MPLLRCSGEQVTKRLVAEPIGGASQDDVRRVGAKEAPLNGQQDVGGEVARDRQ